MKQVTYKGAFSILISQISTKIILVFNATIMNEVQIPYGKTLFGDMLINDIKNTCNVTKPFPSKIGLYKEEDCSLEVLREKLISLELLALFVVSSNHENFSQSFKTHIGTRADCLSEK